MISCPPCPASVVGVSGEDFGGTVEEERSRTHMVVVVIMIGRRVGKKKDNEENEKKKKESIYYLLSVISVCRANIIIHRSIIFADLQH